jgi:hypothetical protein
VVHGRNSTIGAAGLQTGGPPLEPLLELPLELDPEPPLLLPEPGLQTPRRGLAGSGCLQTWPKLQVSARKGLHRVSHWLGAGRHTIPAAQSSVGALRCPGTAQDPKVSPPCRQRSTSLPFGAMTGTHDPGPCPAIVQVPSTVPFCGPASSLAAQGFGGQKPLPAHAVSMNGQSADA